MKTAMQDIQFMLETIWVNTDIVTIESILDYIRDVSIKKEKEQIINAFKYGWNWNYDAEKYYNETFNENK